MRKFYMLLLLFGLLGSSSFGQIVANNDFGSPVNAFIGGIVNSNVLINDTLNGNAVTLNSVNLTFVSTTNPQISLNTSNGNVVAAPGTPAGNYVLTYQICEIGNPSNCDTAVVTVPIAAANLDAVNDTATTPVNGITGGVALTNVLVNDTFNGAPVVPSFISISSVATTHPGISLSGTNVVVAPGTPAGNYMLTYQICENLNPTNCDVATVSVSVYIPTLELWQDSTYVDSSLPAGVSPGDTITYSFVVHNNGNTTLTNLTITDTNAIVSGGSIVSLAPGTSDSTTFTAVHVITQSDIDAGQVDNFSIVTATDPNNNTVTDTSSDPTPCTNCLPIDPTCTTCTITRLDQTPSITVSLDGVFIDDNGNGYADVGENIYYTAVVTNTGNVTLTDVTITSPNSIVMGGPIASLAVGASDMTTFVAMHTITQSDIDAGQVDNIAYAIGFYSNGSSVGILSFDPTPCSNCTPLDANCTSCTIQILDSSALSISISSSYSDYNNDGFTNVGDVINYQYTVANVGSQSITNITGTGSNVTVLGGTLNSLAPSGVDSSTFTAVYVLTQSDINNGFITSSAAFEGNYQTFTITDTAVNTFNLNMPTGIRLNAFVDLNANGFQDTNEPNANEVYGNFNYQINNGVTHSLTASNGMVTLYEGNPLNNYTIGYTMNPSYSSAYTVSPSSYSNITVANGSGITTYNFAITQNPITDLNVFLIPINNPSPGFNYQNRVLIKNQGNQTIASGTITFNVNNVVTITSYPPGSTPTATGFTYNFSNLFPHANINLYVTMHVPTIPTVSLGQQLTNSASATIPPGDINVNNNSATLTQTIVGSYDPNDKQESHGGQIEFDDFSANDYLTYTIRFENTGNADAINIKVEDDLDAQLDESSILMVDASHDYVLDRVGSNLVWKFDGINLPPSVADTQIGHGYITFQIKPKPGYAIGDVIPNSAEIYFDFNPAIITNICNTEFVETLGSSNFAFNNLNYFPNPAQNSLTISNGFLIDTVEITSVLGQQILTQKVNSLQTEINLQNLSNGIYFVKVLSEGQEKTVKVIKE